MPHNVNAACHSAQRHDEFNKTTASIPISLVQYQWFVCFLSHTVHTNVVNSVLDTVLSYIIVQCTRSARSLCTVQLCYRTGHSVQFSPWGDRGEPASKPPPRGDPERPLRLVWTWHIVFEWLPWSRVRQACQIFKYFNTKIFKYLLVFPGQKYSLPCISSSTYYAVARLSLATRPCNTQPATCMQRNTGRDLHAIK